MKEASQKELYKEVLKSSCTRPYVFVIPLDMPEIKNLKVQDRNRLILQTFLREGLHVDVDNNTICEESGISAFQIRASSDSTKISKSIAESEAVAIYFVKAEHIQTDQNVRCYQKTKQIYQPPLKIGGSGRVLQLEGGQECKFIVR